MDELSVYFAFPDGALLYTCETCAKPCCKTSGLAVFPAERETLIRHHPALELVAPGDSDPIQVFAIPPSGCWFLSDGRCTLMGSSPLQPMNTTHVPLRPAACTMFPFNLFGVLGQTLVVAPNGLCPLEVAPSRGMTHARLSEAIGVLGVAGAPPVPLRAEGDAVLPLEIIVRNAAAASLDEESPFPLIAFTELCTDAYLQGTLDTADIGKLPAALDATYDRFAEMVAILGVDTPAQGVLAAIAPLVGAYTPALRLFAFGHLPLELVPRALLALTVYAAHWQALRPTRPLSLHALMQMVSSLGPRLELLASWHHPWPATAPRCEVDVPGSDGRAAQTLRPGDVPAELFGDDFLRPLDPSARLARSELLCRLAQARQESQP